MQTLKRKTNMKQKNQPHQKNIKTTNKNKMREKEERDKLKEKEREEK